MTTEKKHRKDKEIALELEYQVKEVKHQLTEQLKCLDGRLENHFAMTAELADFYQKRSEVEMEYAKNLEKLVKQIMTKHKAERQKRESWQNYSTFKLWQTLLDVTSKQSRCHATFSESLNSIAASHFNQMREDMNYIYRKCYGIATSLHAELHKSMTELHSFLKTYQQYHGESMLLQSKLTRAETQKSKVEQDTKKGTLSKKLLNFDKKTEKQRQKVQEGNLKALKSRNEYLLSIDSTNAALRKYFIDDLPDLINAMDYSYHISLGQVIINSVELEETVNKLNTENLSIISAKAKDLNQISDRQVFLQLHHQIFSLPKRFDFLPHRGDTVFDVQSPSQLRDEMVSRVQTITERLHALKLENDELWKTLETTDNSMVAKMTSPVTDAASIFRSDKPTFRISAGDMEKLAKERADTRNFYFNKFKNYELNSNLAARLQAKCLTLEKVLAISKTGLHSNLKVPHKRSVTLSNRQLKRRTLGKFALEGRPKLFGGSIREYVNATGQEIPLVIRSCTKIINLYGMHHQGVFRIPGLQHEINEYKNMFEKGEEPILVKVETRDINSVAGVLKLYFRELSEPLFPLQLFDELVACSKHNVEEPEELKKCLERLQELLLPLPRTILVVIRYLFAFLNHLSEYSDENMMDAHNLSVCFGPTLIPVPPDHDPVNHQNQINELVRILIVYQEKIFPNDGGMIYEKFIIDEENDLEESVDNLLEGAGGENSEDDGDFYLEAVALHDFQGRSDQEINMKKGEPLRLYKKISADWWEGSTNEQSGLVPHKLIAVSNRRRVMASIDGEDKLFVSTESLPSRSASVTATIHSGSSSSGDNFDRSISQPNICERDAKTTKDKNESALSSTSTITFSESSFSNLSDEPRASGDSTGSRKDSTPSNKEDFKDIRRSAGREVGNKGCDCRRSGTLDRKGENFSPLIPVLEIIEPTEIVLEARDIPPCCSAVVTPVENTDTLTLIATKSSSDSSSPFSTPSNASSSSKTNASVTMVPGTVKSKQPKENHELKNVGLPTSTKLLGTILDSSSESPEKSPRFAGPLTDSFFSYSLVPLETKPPLPTSSRISSTSPSRVKTSRGDSPTVDSSENTSMEVTSFSEGSLDEILIRETDIIEASTSSESPPATTPLHVCEAKVEEVDAMSSKPEELISPSDFFPPPPEELLVGFEKSFEDPDKYSSSDVWQRPHEVNSEVKKEVAEVELPPLSVPSILAYMQNRQKQGDLYHVPGSSQRFIQDQSSPTPQQLNSQYAAVSESIATASLNGSSFVPKTISSPATSSARLNREIVGTKSLDAFHETEDLKKLSPVKIVSSPQVPGSVVASSDLNSSIIRTSAAKPLGSQASPRLSALSMNLPTLSIYTTSAPTTSTSISLPPPPSSSSSNSAQVSITSAAMTTSPVYQSPSAPSSCSPVFHNLSGCSAFKDSPATQSSPQGTPSPSTPTSDKSRSKPPPTLKKPGTKI